ncbi:MAG: hypothetical protein K8T90_05210 [Planctomycetes bacterium]|nr:hypothetical protein [Planctomycetota bacterium]
MFWRQTPRETACHLRALAAERRRAIDLAIFSAWHVAALTRADRLPELTALLERVSAAGDADQNPEEQMDAARSIAASFGLPAGKGR